VSQQYGVVLGVIFDMENQKKMIDERWKVLEPVKKVIKVWGKKL